MDLENFISETLVQISKGVLDANRRVSTSEGKKSTGADESLYSLSPGQDQGGGKGVHFDVAVTTQTSDEGQGGAKMKLAVFEANLGGKLKSSEQAVSRVQFSVAVDQWHK